MKIAVYTIALNEEQFVRTWYESAKEADLLVIMDTGSTDNTVELARSLGIQVYETKVSPWRFDTARNQSLDVVPEDFDLCIALDMDEVLIPGWRQTLDNLDPEVTRPRYKYVWSWKDDGFEGLVYGGDKIHSRLGYFWKHPVHETLTPRGITEIISWTNVEIHHHPDNTKSRGQYFPLLKLAIDEDPDDDRNCFYYARELFFHQMNDEAAEQFKRHLALPRAVWAPERAASMRYLAKLEPQNRESWLLKAVAESPGSREARLDLAEHYQRIKKWTMSIAFAESALDITEQPLEYLCEPDAWSWLPHDLLAVAYFYSGKYAEALHHGKLAANLAPSDSRLIENLTHYEGALNDD